MLLIFTSILPVFFLIGVGLLVKIIENHRHPWMTRFCKYTNHCNDTWSEVLNKFALYVALPALIFGSLIHTDTSLLLSSSMILTNVVLIILFIVLVTILTKAFRIKKNLANAYIMCAFFGNIAYIGPPFINSLIPGIQGTVSILIAIHIIIAFTVGLSILENSKHEHVKLLVVLKSILINPLVLATVVGLFFLYTKIPVPGVIDRAANMLGNSASATVLIAIGLFLAKKIKWDKSMAHAFAISILKLIVMPLIFIGTAIFLRYDSSFSSSILEAGMPVALTNFALAEIYPMDKKIVAKSIIISTILALFTLTGLALFVV
jgi:predicted permease